MVASLDEQIKMATKAYEESVQGLQGPRKQNKNYRARYHAAAKHLAQLVSQKNN